MESLLKLRVFKLFGYDSRRQLEEREEVKTEVRDRIMV